MLYCVIHDKYFQTLSEFETHIEEHQTQLKEPMDLKANPADKTAVIKSVIQEGE